MKRLVYAALCQLLLAVPTFVSAQNSVIPVPQVGLPGAAQATVSGLVEDIITGLLLPIAGIIAVLFLIIGGFQYLLAGANEDLAKRGKSTIQYAIIGLIIIILSYVIVTVVVNTFFRGVR